MITGKLYDWIKFIAQILLPALGLLWCVVEGADLVVGAILAVDLMLGMFLALSQLVYAQKIGRGDLLVEEDENGAQGLRLALDRTPEELVGMREVRFEVKRKRPKLEAVS